ncbi:hypothetical protein HK101_011240 [Irineochytrium annulatum]|nr:hypothetical protein HK101_011240 [Irineochytrium annulatum]
MESPFDVPVRPDLDNIEQLRSLAIEDAGELPVDDTAAPLAASELPPDLGVSAVAHTARVGIAAATAVSELALSSARWGTAMTLGVGRSIIVGALSSARILNRTEAAAANVAHLHAAIDAADVSTSSAGANTSGTLIRKPEPLWLFHQALDTAAQETVQIFDGIFGSTETSRAISSLVQLIRDEMNELNDGQGSLPGNGIIGKTFGTIVLMGSVTKALTAFACLQVMTARRTLQGRKLTRLYEGLVSLDGNGLRAGPPMNLDPSLSLRSPTANDFPKLIEGASIYGGSAFDGMSDEGGPQTPVNGHKEEVFLRWHRDGSTEELTIDLEERHNTRTGFGLDGDPSESMLTLDDARSFIEEAQQHLGTEEVHVIDDASSFIEEASLNSPRGSLMPTLEVSYDGVLNSPTGSHASSRDEDGDHGIMFKTSRSLHHPDTHGIVQQSTVTVAGRMSRDRSYASITGSIASRIAPEDRDFLNRVSRDFSGRDLVELQRALSQSVSHKSFVALPTTSATTSRSATPTPASIGAHFATANSSARTASTYRPPIDGNAPAPEANVNILDGLADHTFDTSRVSTKFEKADRTTTTTITPSPSPPATTNRGWGGMFFLPRKMSKPAEVDSESVNSFVTANSSVSESQHVSLADGTASTAPAPRKSSFTSRVGGILQGMLSSGKRTATPASSGSSGSGQIGHALSAKKAKGGMVTMFDQTSTVEKTADGETRRTATIHMNDRQLSQIKGSPNLEPSLLVPAEGSPKLKPEDTRFELASVVPSPPLTPKPAPSKLITQKSEHVIPATSSSSGGEKSKEFSKRRAGPRIVTRRRERELESSGTSSVGSDYGRSGPWPLVNLLRNLERYARFATAAYGRELMILLGVGKLREIHTDDPLIHTNHYAFSIHTGIPLNDILHSSFTPTVPMPVNPTAVPTSPKMEPLIHYVVLDRAARAVVLSLRGTLGLSDVLTDMRFDYADFRGGRVHAGMLRSAAMMFRKGTVVHMAVERALNDNPGYGLVLTGHSLGGGVAALMALEWSVETGSAISRTPFVTSRSSGLPPNRPIHCYSYGSPCVGTHDLSLAARGLVSTLVNGDDMVPTMSLGLVRDLKVIIMHLLDPSNKGLSERIISRTLGLQRETAGPADPATSAAAAGASASTSAGATAGGADGLSGLDAPHSWDDDYFWSIITKLRASMRNERLFPVGTTYWMESAKTETRHAPGGAGGAPGVATKTTSRVVLQRCDDVREMFSEPRFSSRVMSDHFPRAYEDSLDALVMAVFGKQ